MNLCYKYNPIYWQTANLIVDSGSLDEESNDSTNYDKIAVAIASIQREGVTIEHPLVESAEFGFKPDVKNNQIIFGLKGINGINTEITQLIIQNRPYLSMDDFAEKLIDTKLIKNAKMIQLIKAGCFINLHSNDKRETMDWFLKKYIFTPCAKLGMQQFEKMKELNIIPDSLHLAVQMVYFKKYVLDDIALVEKHIESNKKIPKRGYHDRYYILDNDSQTFFKKYFTEDSIVDVRGQFYIISEKKFTKEVDQKIQPLKNWMNETDTLKLYNEALYKTVWNKYASGSPVAWSMEAACYYDGEHELKSIDEKKYGIVNYYDLPEEPEPYEFYSRYVSGELKKIPKYKISRIAGTILSSNNDRHTVALLTCYGIVNIKFSKGHYAFYNKRISAKLNPNDKKKTVLEESWLKRGNRILVCGIRRGDQYYPLIYADTIYKHTVNLIKEIKSNGDILLQTERTKVEGKE